MNTCIIMFTKAPDVGQVKTRLAPLLGFEGAARFYRELLASAVARFTAVEGCDLQLAVAGDCHQVDIVHLSTQYEVPVHQQVAGDLGAKMSSAAESALRQYDQVLLVGCDCPGLTSDVILSVIRGLSQSSVVFVPAEDGGYVCLGLTQAVPQIFNHIDWGTDKVLQQSLAILSDCHIQPVVLPTLWDTDRPEDYQRYCDLE